MCVVPILVDSGKLDNIIPVRYVQNSVSILSNDVFQLSRILSTHLHGTYSKGAVHMFLNAQP